MATVESNADLRVRNVPSRGLGGVVVWRSRDGRTAPRIRQIEVGGKAQYEYVRSRNHQCSATKARGGRVCIKEELPLNRS